MLNFDLIEGIMVGDTFVKILIKKGPMDFFSFICRSSTLVVSVLFVFITKVYAENSSYDRLRTLFRSQMDQRLAISFVSGKLVGNWICEVYFPAPPKVTSPPANIETYDFILGDRKIDGVFPMLGRSVEVKKELRYRFNSSSHQDTGFLTSWLGIILEEDSFKKIVKVVRFYNDSLLIESSMGVQSLSYDLYSGDKSEFENRKAISYSYCIKEKMN